MRKLKTKDMKQIKSKKTMLGGLRLLAVAVLTLVSLVVKADEKRVQVDINTFENGTVVEKSQSDPDAEESVTVTITAIPAEGYQISAADITVKATAAPGSAETRAGIQIGDLLEVSGPAEAQTGATDYTFVVPQGLGAIVESVLFREVEKPQIPMSGPLGEAGQEDKVTWELTSEAKAGNVLTLTIDGEGNMLSLAEGKTAPWEASAAQVATVVIGKGITQIGNGLLNGLSGLKRIEIRNEDGLVALGDNTLAEGVSVDVPGYLYNEYRQNESWKALTIVSEKAVKMDVSFGPQNDYRTFASSEALRIPSVLKAYVVSGISGSTVDLEEITRIIPANVPVLLFSESLEDNDVRTSASAEAGSATQSMMKVAKKDGQKVELGEVYILFNNVFYLSQAGTIPEGRVYLPVPEEKSEEPKEKGEETKEVQSKTRSYLTIGGAHTTAIDAPITHLSPLTSRYSGAWFSLDGRRLSTAPASKGIYIHNGKKVVIK